MDKFIQHRLTAHHGILVVIKSCSRDLKINLLIKWVELTQRSENYFVKFSTTL